MQATGLLNAGYQGVSDQRLIDARLRHERIEAWLRDIKAHRQAQPEDMLHDEARAASPSAAVRWNRFVRAASPGPSRAAAEIARQTREATLAVYAGEPYQQLPQYKTPSKIRPMGHPSCTGAAPARPGWHGDQPGCGAGALEISQDAAPADSPADSRAGPSGTLQTPTFTWPLARESSSSTSLHSRASAAIAQLRRRATDSATLLRENYDAKGLIACGASVDKAEGRTALQALTIDLTIDMDNGHSEMAAVMRGEHMQKSLDPDESFKTQVLAVLP